MDSDINSTTWRASAAIDRPSELRPEGANGRFTIEPLGGRPDADLAIMDASCGPLCDGIPGCEQCNPGCVPPPLEP